MNELVKSSPMPLSELREMAKTVVASKLFGIADESVAIGLMLLCQSDGLHPVQAMRRYHVISGRPAMKAETMLAEFQANGGKITWLRCDTTGAKAEFMSPGMGAPCTVEWTESDARSAGVLANPTWKKFPRAMYRSRVVSEGVRMSMPGVVLGIYTEDEAEEIVRHETPALTADVRASVIARLAPPIDVEPVPLAETVDDDTIGESVEVFVHGESVGMRDGASAGQKAKAHILKKELGIEDSVWRERLEANYEKCSMAELSYEEAGDLIDKLARRLKTYGSHAQKMERQARREQQAIAEVATTLAGLEREPGEEG